ncbi:hypothetical protein PsorP6_004247 [Peronosclerospora sorghi]|uniref:Uncharacterized protein n=1 Tax=Peronosclerospora sorghi TaxID=230839 RepID=A0ACC0VJ00_9STRA|nr:hypothetical protein PsorP6_004247 [Peronosclerospora sorghi]
MQLSRTEDEIGHSVASTRLAAVGVAENISRDQALRTEDRWLERQAQQMRWEMEHERLERSEEAWLTDKHAKIGRSEQLI